MWPSWCDKNSRAVSGLVGTLCTFLFYFEKHPQKWNQNPRAFNNDNFHEEHHLFDLVRLDYRRPRFAARQISAIAARNSANFAETKHARISPMPNAAAMPGRHSLLARRLLRQDKSAHHPETGFAPVYARAAECVRKIFILYLLFWINASAVISPPSIRLKFASSVS